MVKKGHIVPNRDHFMPNMASHKSLIDFYYYNRGQKVTGQLLKKA